MKAQSVPRKQKVPVTRKTFFPVFFYRNREQLQQSHRTRIRINDESAVSTKEAKVPVTREDILPGVFLSEPRTPASVTQGKCLSFVEGAGLREAQPPRQTHTMNKCF
ncbi:hypothetical protein CDAR_367521 [Caerostris darwini]|uniref:Uncharacterized protein n=1 Tax=Caerostris darwini TaxID=1538125 RepID=A0AAV4Q6W3_9ARAC|nr:hypothetical protein CDAR_367521 [Caerostris darwini]